MVNLTIAAAVIFTGAAFAAAIAASSAHYPLTHGQRTFAMRYCVSEQGGDVGSAYVSKPDFFGLSGPTPRLVIRCTFGAKAYMMKNVDLSRANETPRDGS
jgi:hypothetical protein